MSYSESEAALLAEVEALRRDKAELVKAVKGAIWWLGYHDSDPDEPNMPPRKQVIADLEVLVEKHHERTEQS